MPAAASRSSCGRPSSTGNDHTACHWFEWRPRQNHCTIGACTYIRADCASSPTSASAASAQARGTGRAQPHHSHVTEHPFHRYGADPQSASSRQVLPPCPGTATRSPGSPSSCSTRPGSASVCRSHSHAAAPTLVRALMAAFPAPTSQPMLGTHSCRHSSAHSPRRCLTAASSMERPTEVPITCGAREKASGLSNSGS